MRPHHGHPRRPAIGVTPDLGSSATTALPTYEVRVSYCEAVLRAGGLPLILPYSEDRSCLESFLDRISGLLVTGGHFDIPPQAYGEEPREGLGPTRPERTRFETALLQGALGRRLPVLGVCGGMQLLNVALGGTLVQDIGREVAGAREHQQQHARTQPHHPVEVREGTLLAELIGKGQVMVNSTHHQAVKKLGGEVVASAVAADGVVEAIEAPSKGFALGVQWHPELLIDTVPLHLGLFRALVGKARELRR